jgi:osmotically-inducible protein OsmY
MSDMTISTVDGMAPMGMMVEAITVDSLANRVRSRLMSAPLGAMRDVQLDERDGVVILQGSVPSEFHRRLAEDAVTRVDGVRSVSNELVIHRPPRWGLIAPDVWRKPPLPRRAG